jgi:hypothetical protein
VEAKTRFLSERDPRRLRSCPDQGQLQVTRMKSIVCRQRMYEPTSTSDLASERNPMKCSLAQVRVWKEERLLVIGLP